MSSTVDTAAIVIRRATDRDIRALANLAILDSREPLTGPALVAEVDGVLRAALDLHDDSIAADPFAPTAQRSLRERIASFVRPATARA